MRIIPENTRSSGFIRGIDTTDFIVGLTGAACAFAVYFLGYRAPAFAAALVTVLLLWRGRFGKGYWLALGFLLHLVYRKRFAKAETLAPAPPVSNLDFSQYDVSTDNAADRMGASLKKLGKSYDIRQITAFTGIENGLIQFGGEYFAAVLEILPEDLQFLSEYRQKTMIEEVFATALRSLSAGQSAQLIKLERPVLFDEHIAGETQKLGQIKEAYLNAQLNELELTSGVAIISERLDAYKFWNHDDKIYRGCFYLALFDASAAHLRRLAASCEATLKNGGIPCKRLGDKALAVFLRYQHARDFNEQEIERLGRDRWNPWIMPSHVEFKPGKTVADDLTARTLRINGYPPEARDAWGQVLFNLPDTKVVMQFTPIPRDKAMSRISRELGRFGLGQNRRRGLEDILARLQGSEEFMFDINTYVTVYDDSKAAVSAVRRALRSEGLQTEELLFRQFLAHGATGVSSYDPFHASAVGIPAVSAAAVFPFAAVAKDEQAGINIGLSRGEPVFLNLFKRDEKHFNSNVIVLGREGSGKATAIKALLSNLFADDTRVFVADTQSKYTSIAKKINGRMIDAADPSPASGGRMNPLHIHPCMAGTATGDHGGFEAHLAFLEGFFTQLLPELNAEQIELLLALVANVYAEKGISVKSDIYALKAKDFPTLWDVCASINPAMGGQDSPLYKALTLLKTMLRKLTLELRGPALYNGHESLSPAENFVAFDFRGLLVSDRAAAAHLLLLLNWLEGEIVRTFEYNRLYGAARKTVVVLDDVHELFDRENTFVQDTLLHFAGRIARYNGMLVLCTQDLNAFFGEGEAAKKAAALTGACQYSFIFPVKTEELPALCGLYQKKAELSESEQQQIAQNPRGTAYVISAPDERARVQIAAYPEVTTLIH